MGLEESGHSVVRLSRNGGAEARHFATGDLSETPRWSNFLSGVDVVVHCAAMAELPRDLDVSGIDRLYRVNCQAASSLGRACVDSGVRQLIFLSSAKVYGEVSTGRGPFTESDDLLPEDEYGRSKARAEELLSAFQREGLQVCNLRLPLVYGHGAKGNFQSLRRLALSGLPLPLAGGQNRRSFLSVENLVTVLRCLIEREAGTFSVLNVADPASVSVPELVRHIAQSAGRSERLFYVPAGLLRACARVFGAGKAFDKLMGSFEISTDRLSEYLPEAELYHTSSAILRLGQDRHGTDGAQGH